MEQLRHGSQHVQAEVTTTMDYVRISRNAFWPSTTSVAHPLATVSILKHRVTTIENTWEKNLIALDTPPGVSESNTKPPNKNQDYLTFSHNIKMLNRWHAF